jgi:hypothetical protein
MLYVYMYVVYFVMHDFVLLILLLSYGHHDWFNKVFLLNRQVKFVLHFLKYILKVCTELFVCYISMVNLNNIYFQLNFTSAKFIQTILANESLHSKDCVLKWSILLENKKCSNYR